MILTSITNGSEYSVTENVEPQELKPIIHAKEEYEKMKAFCEWVASEVVDEESWKDNSDSFAEISCRKLHKLGIVEKQGDSWVFWVYKRKIEDGNDE